MKIITHFYSLSSQWQDSFAEAMGAKIIDNKIIIIPETLGTGYIYFTEVADGVSALFKDYRLKSPIRMNKLVSEEEFYIFHYNPTEYVNYESDGPINLNLVILNNQVENIYEPAVNERIIGFSLFIDKKMMHKYVGKMPYSEFFNEKLNNSSGCYNDCIDSKSLGSIFSLKEKSMFDVSFDYYLKGTSYKLLANFLSSSINLTSL
jgi:hypothetical protein